MLSMANAINGSMWSFLYGAAPTLFDGVGNAALWGGVFYGNSMKDDVLECGIDCQEVL